MSETKAEIGCWYLDGDGALFEVVAIDERAQTIELQYFDGAVAELEFSAWGTAGISAAEPPEDVRGAFGEEESENLGYRDDEVIHPDPWRNPVEELDLDRE